jgi:tetratricopeptide (TPR) repeat protein
VIEIPLIRHENYPSLILKTRVAGTEEIQNLLSNLNQKSPSTNVLGSLAENMRLGLIGYGDFSRYGKLESLEQAIMSFRNASTMVTEDNTVFPAILDGLGTCLRCRFEQLGNIADIDESIALKEKALNLTPEGDHAKSIRLSNLGTSFRRRFERLGNIADLDNAIASTQAAVSLTPDNDSDKPRCLDNLGGSLAARFERLGDLADLKSSTASHQAAVNLALDSHPCKSMYLSNLGHSLEVQFGQLGNIADLDNAIASHRAAVSLTPDGHPSKARHLSHLGNSLKNRYQRLRDLGDLDEAIVTHQAAVSLTPSSHPDKPLYLTNLGISFESRFRDLKNLGDLEIAIKTNQEAVHLTPDGHPLKPGRLSNLGLSLDARFGRLGDLADLNDAIAAQQAAVRLTPDGHFQKPGQLNNLGMFLKTRFERLGNLADLDDAITSHQAALDLTPGSHYNNPAQLISLGVALCTRSLHNHPEDIEPGILHLSAAATSKTGLPSLRFTAAKLWGNIASTVKHPSLLAAYECAISIMPLVAWLGLPLTDRHQHLVEMGGITRDAVAAAISLEEYDKALEWLEQGRSIVWTQILQLRTPVDDLRDVRPDLAERLVQVSRLLDQGPKQSDISSLGNKPTEEEGRQYRALAMEHESIIDQIRSLANFEHFLRPPRVSQLMKAARDGPVVVLNVAERCCDALALIPGLDRVMHIPLPDITFERATRLENELRDLLYSGGARTGGERAAKKVEDEIDSGCCKRILSELWNSLVQPVLGSLGFSVRSILFNVFPKLMILSLA